MADDTHELVAAYALDALDDLERRRFESHLEDCPNCLEELAGFAEVAAALTSSDAVPSRSLKAATLDTITRTPQVSSAVGGATSSAGSGDTRVADKPVAGLGSGPGSTGVGSGGNRWPLLVAAAVIAVVAVAALGAMVSNTNGDEPDAEVAAVLDAPDAVRVALSADDPAREGTDLAVVHSPSGDAAVVVGDHVHGTDADHVYQLWGETPEGMKPAGLFTPDEDGIVQVPVDTELADVESWNVTVEPVGGSEEPSTDIVFTSAA